MNKKVIAAAVGILLVASLASCGRNSDGGTTTAPVLGTAQTAASNTANVSVTEAQDDKAPTYILTTQQGQTMATVPTTAFALETLATQSVNIPTSFYNPGMTVPVVNESKIPSTAPPTTKETTTKESTTEETTEAPTEPVEKVRTAVDIASAGAESNGNFVITFEPDGWDGGVKTRSGFITVDIDGKQYPVKAAVSGRLDGDGYATITVYTNELEPGEGSVITCNFPAGFITSKNGTQTSIEFSSQGVYATE